MIDDPNKKVHSDSVGSKEEATGFVKSAVELTEEAAKEKAKASQFYLSLDETGKIVPSNL